MNFTNRLALCWRILRAKPGNLLKHAERELPSQQTRWPDYDEMQEHMNQSLKEMVFVFGTQGHSGYSASFAAAALAKLLAYEPIGPLTGEPHEWVEVGPGVHQNNRCGRVFKQADRFDGQAYDIDGTVFREPNGACFTNRDSMVPITFPYTPTTVYVDVPADMQAA